MDFQDILNQVLVQQNYTFKLKEQQITGLRHVFDKKHTLVVQPTGYGKSELLKLSPILLNKVNICALLSFLFTNVYSVVTTFHFSLILQSTR